MTQATDFLNVSRYSKVKPLGYNGGKADHKPFLSPLISQLSKSNTKHFPLLLSNWEDYQLKFPTMFGNHQV